MILVTSSDRPLWSESGSPDDPRLLHSDISDRIRICPSHRGRGYRQEISLEKGLSLQILHYELCEDFSFISSHACPCLEFEFRLAGPRAGSSCILPYLGFDLLGLRRANVRVFKVEVLCKGSVFAERLRGAIARLPQRPQRILERAIRHLQFRQVGRSASQIETVIDYILNSFPADSHSTLQHLLPRDLYLELVEIGFALQNCPITPEMGNIVTQILHCEHRGEERRAYLKRKVLDLVELRLNAIFQPQLCGTELDGIYRAADILRSHLATPPTVADLARRVCLNRNKLNQGFRTVYGTTPFGYLRSVRHWEARRLLMTSELKVEEIGAAVGYTNRSRFATSFRQESNWNPKAFQCQVRHWLERSPN